jgi:HJR/Mrr/RecB family endonuclease
MAPLYGIIVMILGAFYPQQEWIITAGLLLFVGGSIWAVASLLLENSNINLTEYFDDLIQKRKEARLPPLVLKKKVDSLAKLKNRDSKLPKRLLQTRQEAINYPSLLLKLDQIDRHSKIPAVVSKHSPTLRMNLTRAVKKDDYGTVLTDNRSKEIQRFLLSMNLAAPSEDARKDDERLVKAILKLQFMKDQLKGFDPNTAPQNGIAFEYWVAEQLEKYGWKTQVTKGSGEQGCDIIAEIDRLKIGVQCKRYTDPVNNTAVQQALGSIPYYGLDKAVVVTTSDYTRSAKELALSAGIILLTVLDIPKMREIVDAS